MSRGRWSRTKLHQARHVAREQVDLEIYAVAGLFAPPRRHRQGVRDEVDAKTRARHLVDRERGAIEGDRALRRNVACKMLGHLEREAAALAIRDHLDDARETIDVPSHDMAAH